MFLNNSLHNTFEGDTNNGLYPKLAIWAQQ